MVNSIISRSAVTVIILTVLGIGYTFAHNKVVVIPFGDDQQAAGIDGQVQYKDGISTAGAEVYYDKGTGHLGINVSTPDQLLHLRQDETNSAIRIQHQSTTDWWETGIGTTTKNYKFYYNNLFRADISSVDGSYVQSSDGRLKYDINYIAPVLQRVLELKPAQYKYIGSSPEATPSTGFVAQEVEEVFPELVRDLDDGYKGVIYDGFAVISIKAIQELHQQIEIMQTEIEELKKVVR